uniref:Uncharacterized protein n=1 Tax=Lepeophtheirus salmonis TaxID=72036 RepID=A0A0K2T850_LEPSM
MTRSGNDKEARVRLRLAL